MRRYAGVSSSPASPRRGGYGFAGRLPYACDGELSIDNNVSERSVRAQAIGRKNYLFVGSDRGGRTAATLYSLVGTCNRHQIDPFAYLKDILERLPTHAADQLGELLPDMWIAANPQARVKLAS
jgi:transposase